MEGCSREAMAAAQKVTKAASPEIVREAPRMEFATPIPLYTMVRFGKVEVLVHHHMKIFCTSEDIALGVRADLAQHCRMVESWLD